MDEYHAKEFIAQEIRRDINLKFWKRFSLEEALPILYDKKEDYHTKNGVWQIYTRENFQLPYFLEEEKKPASNDFCALYFDKEKPVTMFSGDLENILKITETAQYISDNFLDNKELNTDNGKIMGQASGYWTTIGIFFAGIADSILSVCSQLSNRFNYNGIILPFLEKQLGPESSHLSYAAVATCCTVGVLLFFYGNVALQKGIFKSIGKKKDRKRVEDLPDGYEYYMAEAQLCSEFMAFKRENYLIEKYEEAKEAGITVSKPYFKEIYELMTQPESHIPDFNFQFNKLKQFLQNNPNKEQVPIDKLMNLFSKFIFED